MNVHSAIQHLFIKMQCEAYSWFTGAFEKTVEDEGIEEFETQYNKARCKICEITALRALARPLPQNSTMKASAQRKSMVQKAQETIKSLEGTTPLAVQMMMTNVLEATAAD